MSSLRLATWNMNVRELGPVQPTKDVAVASYPYRIRDSIFILHHIRLTVSAVITI